MNFKKIISNFLLLSAAMTFTLQASAHEKEYSEGYYDYIFAAEKKSEEVDHVEIGDAYYRNFPAVLPHIQEYDNQIIYIFAQFTDRKGVYSDSGVLQIDLHTTDRKKFTAELDLGVSNFYTASEIVELSGISDYKKVEKVTVSFPDNCMNLYLSCAPMDNGWNMIDNLDYYVKGDGTMIKKSCKINGIRYKFTSEGVCLGKYTGWTKSANGKRYYKDGMLIVNKRLKTSDGKSYCADENGYVTEIN